MTISCPVLDSAGFIPSAYTCDGNETIPPLQFMDAPENAQSLALIMRDPDAPHGEFTHWVVWNIPPLTRGIDQGELPSGQMGTNDANKVGYTGPCPPHGIHHYHFDLYALDTMLNLAPGASVDELKQAMATHVVDSATTVGMYQKR